MRGMVGIPCEYQLVAEERALDLRHFKAAVEGYHKIYLKLLGEIISHRRVLPSLEFFEWGDNTSLSTPFITALAHLNVKNLIISNPLVDDEVSIRPLLSQDKNNGH
jgi:hypothetical protein